MSGTDGLTDIEVSSIQIQYGLGVGQNSNEGLDGQVLSSQGRDKPMRWVNQSGGALQKLTQSTGITISPDGEYDGSVAQSISATFPAFTGGNGITIDGTGAITTNNDGTTMINTGGDGTQNAVLKVPNDLTAGSNISFSSGTTYNGSSAITISSTDTNTEYTATAPINISLLNDISVLTDGITIDGVDGVLKVREVPFDLTCGNGLTFTSGTTFDGADPRQIQADTDEITITKTGGTGDELEVLKVPNKLKKGINVEFRRTSDNLDVDEYDGSEEVEIRIPNQNFNLPQYYNWWTTQTNAGVGFFNGTGAFRIPTSDHPNPVYHKLFLNPDTQSGDYVKLKTTLPAGGRYFLIQLKFQYAYANPSNTTVLKNFFTSIRWVNDDTNAELTKTDGTTSISLLSIQRAVLFDIEDQTDEYYDDRESRYIYDAGGILPFDTIFTFRPEICNLMFFGDATQERDFLIATNNTTLPAGGVSAVNGGAQEFTGKIISLGGNYEPNGNRT